MQIRNLLGFALLFPWHWGKHGFVPGKWTPRYDQHGRIYMLLSQPDEWSDIPSQSAASREQQQEEK